MDVFKTQGMIAALFLMMSSAVANVGFQSGDEFTSQDFVGSFTLFCPGGSKRVSCSGYGLSPAEFDYLTFPATIDADKVKLTRISSRGSQRSKTSKVRNGEGRSSKRFNLWIRTLFQRPLLVMGNNTIKYNFEKDGDTTAQGEFSVMVKEGPTMYCRHIVMNGTSNDCNNPLPLCSQYFSRTTCN
jgi:hypothetical protein